MYANVEMLDGEAEETKRDLYLDLVPGIKSEGQKDGLIVKIKEEETENKDDVKAQSAFCLNSISNLTATAEWKFRHIDPGVNTSVTDIRS